MVRADTDFVIPEAVGVKFLQEPPRVVDEELPHLLPGVVEDAASSPAVPANEVEIRIPPGAVRGALQEPQALIVERPAGVVVDDVQHNGKSVHVTEIDERLELILLGQEVDDIDLGEAFLAEQPVGLVEVRPDFVGAHRVIHLGREKISVVVAPAVLPLPLDHGQRLNGGHAERRQVLEAPEHVEEPADAVRPEIGLSV